MEQLVFIYFNWCRTNLASFAHHFYIQMQTLHVVIAIHGFAIHIHKNLERNPFWIARETCILFSYRRKEAKR